ncbi:hypothetical protein [Novacetimonas pomaceti]|uniref:hypothetical protein n=1 Tax=Novacetimonas pomaceti TaxID=2021998 RepID=UPI001057CC58|nr:hypothetical protein [Novacetimonas pomaceti]
MKLFIKASKDVAFLKKATPKNFFDILSAGYFQTVSKNINISVAAFKKAAFPDCSQSRTYWTVRKGKRPISIRPGEHR